MGFVVPPALLLASGSFSTHSAATQPSPSGVLTWIQVRPSAFTGAAVTTTVTPSLRTPSTGRLVLGVERRLRPSAPGRRTARSPNANARAPIDGLATPVVGAARRAGAVPPMR